MAAPKSGVTAKKRSSERHGHRTLAEKSKTEIIKAEVVAPLSIPDPEPSWGTAAKLMWNACLESPLAKYYEQTDIAYIWVLVGITDRLEKQGFSSPGQLMAWANMTKDLGLTEIQRRAASIEIQRQGPAVVDEAKVARLDEYRRLLG